MSKKTKSSKSRIARAKQTEIPLTGDGVEICTDKQLIELGNKRIEETESIGAARAELKKINADILNRMGILNLKSYRVDDKLFLNAEKHVVKVSKVKHAAPETPEAQDAPLESGTA